MDSGDYPDVKLLRGKICAITGGSTGIGKAICLEMIRQGACVAINYLDDAAASKTHIPELVAEVGNLIQSDATSKRLITIAGDISLPETSEKFIKETVAHFKRLDVFVSNAGVCKFADFLTIEPELYKRTIEVNLDGAFYSTQAAAKQMKLQGNGGSIIAISSISALVGGAGQTHYTPTKAGVLSLMQSCATALGQYGIRCNSVLPGTIKTQMNEDDLSVPEKKKYMESRTPLGRIGVPSDIAGPVVFLASDFSRFMSGSQILVGKQSPPNTSLNLNFDIVTNGVCRWWTLC